MKVSIIIPVFNNENYLKECLDSVVNQFIDEKEIIIINDGSIDNSLDIINEYIIKYPDIILINQENKGVSAARNEGLKVAKGEYIGFVDADDYVNPFMYEIMYKYAVNTHSDIAFCDYLEFKDNINYKISKLKNICQVSNIKIVKKILSGKTLPTMCKYIVKNDLFKNTYFPNNLKCGEDFYVLIDILLNCNNIVYIPYKLYFYRKYFGSSTNMGYNMNCWNDLIAVEHNKLILKQKKVKLKYELNLYRIKCIDGIISCYSNDFKHSIKYRNRYINKVLNKFYSRNDLYKFTKSNSKDNYKTKIVEFKIRLHLKYPYLSIYIRVILFILKRVKLLISIK